MHVYTDAQGKAWEVRLNVTLLRRVRDVLGIDLNALVADGLAGLGKFLRDPMRVVEVLFVLCEEQAQRDGVSPEDFGTALYGDSIVDATDALLEELIDFFPNPRTRKLLRELIAKSREVRDLVTDDLSRQILALDSADVAKSLSVA
jgi:hypothetical protein